VAAIVEHFDAAKILFEQRPQVETREKIAVIAFEQMPGRDQPVGHERQYFHIGNGKYRLMPGYPGYFGEEGVGLADMFEHFDGHDRVKLTVASGQSLP
jgi:hypothetical protein